MVPFTRIYHCSFPNISQAILKCGAHSMYVNKVDGWICQNQWKLEPHHKPTVYNSVICVDKQILLVSLTIDQFLTILVLNVGKQTRDKIR